MPEPPDRITFTMQATETPDTAQFFVVVTIPEELPAALKQHQKPVVIENTPDNAELIRAFKRWLRWRIRRERTYQLLIIGGVVVWVSTMFTWFTTAVITNRYNLDAGWHVNWEAREVDGFTMAQFSGEQRRIVAVCVGIAGIERDRTVEFLLGIPPAILILNGAR